jgi:hypothetical protein
VDVEPVPRRDERGAYILASASAPMVKPAIWNSHEFGEGVLAPAQDDGHSMETGTECWGQDSSTQNLHGQALLDQVQSSH